MVVYVTVTCDAGFRSGPDATDSAVTVSGDDPPQVVTPDMFGILLSSSMAYEQAVAESPAVALLEEVYKAATRAAL